ncbi:aspartate/glutamate racemase family protein [Aquisediminimonas profunda]|uniref:aspartate/glutamate racemase family protein n=1 Tax=Aquisediminimonas profunda TaxID=1550733 RepID=UPI001C63149C|nr:aspartate/glutamate racemase family protein [Aquisediminimonas profunda]
MAAKILWLSDSTATQHGTSDPVEQDIIFSNMLGFAKKLARPDTEIDIAFLEHNIGSDYVPTMRYPRTFMAVEMVERIMQAEADGYDAAFAGMCYGEFFLQDARQAVRMPVVGPAESAMIVAQSLGKKFAVLTTAVSFEHVMEENIRFHRWEGAAISHRPVRSLEFSSDGPEGVGRVLVQMMLDAYAGRPERMIEQFDQAAQELVRDGADVVICGCNPLGAALSQVGYNEVSGTGVPVVTALPAQIKMAEMLIDLKRGVGWSKTEAVVGPYLSTPPEILDDLAARGIGMPQVRKNASKSAKVRLHAA